MKDDELKKFLFDLNHDLKSPLMAIEGFARVLLEDENLNLEEKKRVLNRILNNCQKMAGLIEELVKPYKKE